MATELARNISAKRIGKLGYQSDLKNWTPKEEKPQLKHLLAEIDYRGGKKKASLSAEGAVAWLIGNPPKIQGESSSESSSSSEGSDDNDGEDEDPDEKASGADEVAPGPAGGGPTHNEAGRVMKAALSKKEAKKLNAKLNGKSRFMMSTDGTRLINACAAQKTVFLSRDENVDRQGLEAGQRW